MPMSTDAAVTFGRELYGEPKKLAKIVFERQDEHVWGSAERHEIRYLSLRGRMDGRRAHRPPPDLHLPLQVPAAA